MPDSHRQAFTYEDHHGSLQHAAAISPRFQCPYFRCGVVVSLPTAGFSPQEQVMLYGFMNGTLDLGLISTIVTILRYNPPHPPICTRRVLCCA